MTMKIQSFIALTFIRSNFIKSELVGLGLKNDFEDLVSITCFANGFEVSSVVKFKGQ